MAALGHGLEPLRQIQSTAERVPRGDTLHNMAATLVELTLPSFKSLRQVRVPLRPLTLLVGRNGSGKSNVLDALAVLSSLASGGTIRDALDGGRSGPLVRGGSEGCAPLGEDSFSVGCCVLVDGNRYHLDVEVSVRPDVQVISERLWTRHRGGARNGEPRELLATDPPRPDSGDIVARWDNKKRGPNPGVTFRASQLLTAQVATRVPATSQAGRDVRRVAEEVLAALSTVFILDPVPHQMRDYVPEKDLRLRRNAENLSAVLASLLKDEATRGVLLHMTQSLTEAQVSEIDAVNSDLGDVMVAIQERIGSNLQAMPARLMSDGTLRFLAIAAALLDRSKSASGTDHSVDSGRQLVVEEIENGLHPSQAALLLNRLKASALTGVHTLATTHSPAILDSLDGTDHTSVLVCSRGSDGWSKATQLTDFPDYFEVIGQGTLGTAAVRDRLRPSASTSGTPRSLVDLLGLQ
ncbi:MAG: ATP-binding protein [bacterium]|nr:ATP-binding protein [bacterium]